MSKSDKTYLGDGVYASFDGYHVMLTTEDGLSVTNEIYLDPSVQIAPIKYMDWLSDQ